MKLINALQTSMEIPSVIQSEFSRQTDIELEIIELSQVFVEDVHHYPR